MSSDDSCSVENRGGLEAVIERTTENLDYESSAQDLAPENVNGTLAPRLGSSNNDIETNGARVEFESGQPL